MGEIAYSSQEIKNGIETMLNQKGMQDYSEASKEMMKTGMQEHETYDELRKKMVEILSDYLSEGLIQATIETIAETNECRAAIGEKGSHAHAITLTKLPALLEPQPFKPYVEVVIKMGAMDIKKIKFSFLVKPKVEVKDVKVVIDGDRIRSVSFGTFVATLELSLMKGETPIHLHSWKSKLNVPEIQL